MEEIGYIVATILLLGGIIGSIIPVLPGPLLSYVGALILYWFTDHPFSPPDIWVMGAVTVLVSMGDYLLQVFGVKKLGGGKMAIRGTVIGTIIGLFFTPIGLLLGAFIGAFVGARTETEDEGKALKIAMGSMIGFLFGTFIKLVFALYMIYYLIMLPY